MRFGILGTARIADTLIPAIRSVPGCSVAAVASRTADRARRWADERDIPLAFGSYADLLDSGTVDAAYVALPNRLHAEWALAAIRAGLPVLCEKPFACNAFEAERVAAAADGAGVVVVEAFMHRFHPLHDRILDIVRSGRIGDLTSIASVFTFRLDDRSEIPASAALAGGALMDVGCYCVEFSRRVAGREPIRASAFERRTSVDDTLCGMLAFDDGPIATFECSIESFERQGAVIAGTLGEVRVSAPWLQGTASASFEVRCEDGVEVVEVPGADAYALEVADFVGACREGRTPRWNAADAVRNTRVLDALFESARTGTAVPLQGGSSTPAVQK